MTILYILFLTSYMAYLVSIFYIMLTTDKYKSSKDFYIDWLPGGYVVRLLIEKIIAIEKTIEKNE